MRKYEYIVFDFNGTILNDVDLCWHILNDMLIKHHKPAITKENYRSIFQFPIERYYSQAGFDFMESPYNELAIEFIKEYKEQSLQCPLCEGVLQALKILAPQAKLILLSASEKSNLYEQIRHFDIEKYFYHVIGLDNIYAGGKVEAAEAYFLQANVDMDKVLFIGDTDHDCEVAKTLGGTCYLVASGHQSRERLCAVNKNVYQNILEIVNTIMG